MGYIGATPSNAFINNDVQRVTNSTNNYVDLDHNISSLDSVIVFVNNVRQESTNLTFTSASRIGLGDTLQNSDVVEVVFIGKAVATQSAAANSITNDMLSGSIANSKLANSSITLNGSAVSLGGSATVGEANTPSWYAYQTSTQSLANNTTTLFSPTSIVKNTDSVYDSSNGRFTVPSGGDGFYFVYGHFRINNYDPNRCSAVFFVNGSEQNWSLHEHAPEGGLTSRRPVIHATAMMNLSATDYVEFKGHQGSGSTDTVLNIVFGGFKITT